MNAKPGQRIVARTEKISRDDNLLDGSKSHLRAFVGRLRRPGVEYKPIILSPEEFEAIFGN